MPKIKHLRAHLGIFIRELGSLTASWTYCIQWQPPIDVDGSRFLPLIFKGLTTLLLLLKSVEPLAAQEVRLFISVTQTQIWVLTLSTQVA